MWIERITTQLASTQIYLCNIKYDVSWDLDESFHKIWRKKSYTGQQSKNLDNSKKVLLRERKRHTVRRVVDLSPDMPTGRVTPIQSWLGGGYTHPVWLGVPHPILTGVPPLSPDGVTPIQSWWGGGYPHSGLNGVTGVPPSSLDRGVYPYPVPMGGYPRGTLSAGWGTLPFGQMGYPLSAGWGYPIGQMWYYPPHRPDGYPLLAKWGYPLPPAGWATPLPHQPNGIPRPPPKCGQTDTCENSTFPRTSYTGCKMMPSRDIGQTMIAWTHFNKVKWDKKVASVTVLTKRQGLKEGPSIFLLKLIAVVTRFLKRSCWAELLWTQFMIDIPKYYDKY